MATFQIRDDYFGYDLYEAETATEALLDFLANWIRGDLRQTVEVQEEHADAEVVYKGVRYRAVRAD